MSEDPGRFKVWQCVGCGRIDDPQPCIGVCRDEKVEFVLASAHDEALLRAREEISALRAVLSRIANTTPRVGQWERAWRALQGEAREVLRDSSF